MSRDERTAPWAIWAYQCLYGIVWDRAYARLGRNRSALGQIESDS